MTSLLKFTPEAMPGAEIEALHAGRAGIVDSAVERIQSLIASGGTMHVMLVGRRGSGKTHTLQMIRHGLGDRIVPAVLAQEEYSAYTVDGFFARVLESIGEGYDGPEVTYRARDVLKRLRQEGRPVVVFAENLQALFAQMEPDLGELRAVMQEDESFFIAGSALAPFVQVTSMSAPFYNFFEINRLDGLDPAEIGELVGRRSGPDATAPVGGLSPEGLRALTGGNPRLVHALCDEADRNPGADLEDCMAAMLDGMTPEYRSVAEAMPAEVRKIFDAMALADGPLTPTEIALKMGTKNTITAAQINRMKNGGLVEPVKFGRKKETRYQITEWMYPMWREFRRGGRSAKLRAFADLLKALHSEERGGPADPMLAMARASGVLAAEKHGAPEWGPRLPAEGWKKIARRQKSGALRLCAEIAAADAKLRACGRDGREFADYALRDKARHLEGAVASARIPRTKEAHSLLGLAARTASELGMWQAAEKAVGAARACAKAHCHGCAVLGALASAQTGRYERAAAALGSALRGPARGARGESELFAYKIHMHARMGERVDVGADSARMLERGAASLPDAMFAHFEMARYDEALEIMRQHAPRLGRLAPGERRAAAAGALTKTAIHVMRRRPDEYEAKAMSACLGTLEPFVWPGAFGPAAAILAGCGIDPMRAAANVFSGAFGDGRMGAFEVIRCAARYADTQDASLFERLGQEQRILAFSVVREIAPSAEIPRHVLDSAQ